MKRLIGVFLMMVMMLSSIFVLVPPMEVRAATTYDFLWPVQNGGVSQYFKGSGVHGGMDIVSSGNDIIYAAAAGTVIRSEHECGHWDSYDSKNKIWKNKDCEKQHKNTYGNRVVIQHADGTVAIYGHLAQDGFDYFNIKNGKTVEVGEPIGYMGSSGMSSGKHLHFELRAFSQWGSPGTASTTKFNINPISQGGLVNYRYYGYEGQVEITPATITEGTYFLNNGGYRVYMKEDKEGSGSIGASNSATNNNFEIVVEKDGSYYLMYPTATSNSYVLNCYWGKGGTATKSGNEITLWKSSGDVLSKRWIFEEYGGGYLIHPADNMSLSVTREGNTLYVKTTTKAANQIWTLENTECDHTYEYSYENNTQHWQECTKCGDKKNYGAHQMTYSQAVDSFVHIIACEICGFAQGEEHIYSNSSDTICNVCGYERACNHTYEYKYDPSEGDTVSARHWQECTKCGDQKNLGAHNWIPTTSSHESFHIMECTICELEVGIFHNDSHYNNTCDPTCNFCGSTREVTHTYSNECDSSCNVCGAIRSVTHTYSNSCDASCNVCGVTRSVSHTYSNNCDTSCNVCGAKRSVAHTYDNDCDTTCNGCGATRQTSHKYSNNCDTSCNICGAKRSVVHTYDNDCDTTCNGCGATRQTSHKYSNACDASCNVCGAARQTSHKYSNSCDASCNVCGVTRSVTHTYDNDCDTTCNGCGATRQTSHKYSNSCDASCNVCGVTRQAPHSFDEYRYNNESHWQICSVCGVADGSHYNHSVSSFNTATDTSHSGICSICRGRVSYDHIYIDVCDAYCDVCNLKRQAPHSYTDINDKVCNLCGEERETICTDHDFGAWAEISDPTCEVVGMERRECKNCGYFESKELAMIDHKDENEDNDCDMCGKQMGGKDDDKDDGDKSDRDDNDGRDDEESGDIIGDYGVIIIASLSVVVIAVSVVAIRLAFKKKD